jgi:hypothetical protein
MGSNESNSRAFDLFDHDDRKNALFGCLEATQTPGRFCQQPLAPLARDFSCLGDNPDTRRVLGWLRFFAYAGVTSEVTSAGW